MEGNKTSVESFVIASEGKISLGIYKSRWEDNIKEALKQIGCGIVGYIPFSQYRDQWRTVPNTAMNLHIP